MKIKDEVLEALRQGVPWPEIVKRYRGKSSVYSAIAEFRDETDKVLNSRYHELERTKNELDQLKSEKIILEHKVEQNRKSEANLSASCQKLSEVWRQKKIKVGQLETRAVELEKKGYSPNVIKQLFGNDSKSATELMERVSTAEKHVKLKNGLAEINIRAALLGKEVANAQTRKQQLERSIISQRNELDEMKTKTATFKDATNLATILLKNGYSTEEIESLIVGLNVVSIAGDNKVSLRRLVDALRKLKTHALIDEEIRDKQSELIELKKTSREVKSELTIARDRSLESIVEAADAAKKTISELSDQIAKHTKDAVAKFESNLDSSLAGSCRKFDDNLTSSLTNADNHLKNLATNLEKDLVAWRTLQEEAARVREHILPGRALLSASGSMDDLKNVDLPLVARLCAGLSLWFEMNLKDATVRPSDDMHRKDSSLSAYYDYKLSVLVELVSKGVRQQLLAENKNVQTRG